MGARPAYLSNERVGDVAGAAARCIAGRSTQVEHILHDSRAHRRLLPLMHKRENHPGSFLKLMFGAQPSEILLPGTGIFRAPPK